MLSHSRAKPIARGNGWAFASSNKKKGTCREARPLNSSPSDDGTDYFNASMPAPKLM